MISNNGAPDADDNDAVDMPDMVDLYINMEVVLPRGNYVELYHAMVKQFLTNDYGNPLGVETSNPITDTIIYELDYLDRVVKTLAENVIAKKMLSRVDQEGRFQLLIDKMIEHSKTP